jgi:hypothetical protein
MFLETKFALLVFRLDLKGFMCLAHPDNFGFCGIYYLAL